MKIKESELIINKDGSIYHLNLKPEDIATNVILVGDQGRVDKVAKHFDEIEVTKQKREFRSITGTYKGKRITVLSSGIGPDNIDIVLNELDALVNIDFETREVKKDLTQLNIVRIGTSGSLQADIPVDSILISEYGLDINGMLQTYKIDSIVHTEIEDAFIEHTNWSVNRARPVIVDCDKQLLEQFKTNMAPNVFVGTTATAGGFYGAQGRVLRLAIPDNDLNSKIDSFNYNGFRITNLEMETASIFGLSKLLGHRACTLNAIIANRANGTFTKDSAKIVEETIKYTLERF